jgi:hypothetical protein
MPDTENLKMLHLFMDGYVISTRILNTCKTYQTACLQIHAIIFMIFVNVLKCKYSQVNKESNLQKKCQT